MKKLSAVLLAVLMVLTCFVPMASAYDKETVAAGNYDGMTNEDVLGAVLDWLDSKIEAVAPDFDEFEQYAQFIEAAGYEIPEITGVDSLVAYKDHLGELGGDFANLQSTDLIVKRADAGNTGFVNGMIAFMAANADTFGKVFRWDDDVFDYGKVGEYIETLDANDPIRVFYNDYLVGGNIQDKFIREIAREMNYDVPDTRTESFDDILNNGIKAAFAPILKDALKTEESKAAYDAFNLKTTDVYALVKAYVGLLQNDYKADLDAMAKEIVDGIAAAVKAIKDTLGNIDTTPPTVTIKDYGTFVAGPYQPGSANPQDYMPTIYTTTAYKEMIDEQIGTLTFDIEGKPVTVTVTDEAAPEGLKTGTATALVDGFKMNVKQTEDLMNLEISFKDIENEVNAQIAAKLPEIQAQVDAAVAQAVASANAMVANLPAIISGSIGEITGSVTINSLTVSLSYAGYSTDDAFAMEVTVEPHYDITYGGNVWEYAQYAGITTDKIESDYIQPAIAQYLTNPVATVAVSNLNGFENVNFDDITKLLGYVKDDITYVSPFDFVANYDAYKGVVGQMNHILYAMADMVLTDEGKAYFGLQDGGNDKLDANVTAIRTKAEELMGDAKDAVAALKNNETLAQFIPEGLDLDAIDLGFIGDIDLSSNEALYVSLINLAADYVPAEMKEVKEIVDLVKGSASLDEMLVKVLNKCIPELLAKVPGFTYNYTDIAANTKDAALDKLADIAYEAASFVIGKANDMANDLIVDINSDFGLGIGKVNFQLKAAKGANWNETIGNLLDRFIDVTTGLTEQTFDKSKGTVAKASDILNAVLPMSSMLSGTTDLTEIDGYADAALDGNFSGLLSLFEVKEDAIAGDGISVTKALINASDYIVDAFFPDTVQAELYPQNETVQETFTGNESDQGIAARNMVSINANKDRLINAGCNLLKESDILKSLVCDHANVTTEDKAATCTETGWTGSEICATCGAVLSKGEEVPALGHNMVAGTPVAPTCTAEGYTVYTCANGCGTTEKKDIVPAKGHNLQLVDSKDATCTEAGYKKYACANGCGETKTETINAKGHSWGDWKTTKEATEDEEGQQTRTCSVCGATETQTIGKKSVNFFQRIIRTIRGFFDRIVSWFRGIFSR